MDSSIEEVSDLGYSSSGAYYNDDNTINTKELNGFHSNRHVVLEGPLPVITPRAHASYLDHHYPTRNPPNSSPQRLPPQTRPNSRLGQESNSTMPGWLSSAPFYLKATIVSCSILFIVSLTFVATGMFVIAYSGRSKINNGNPIRTNTGIGVSITPTVSPSFSPLVSPSNLPTLDNSYSPSMLPTLTPEVLPRNFSSESLTSPNPTVYPSGIPTIESTHTPTETTTTTPTNKLTNIPSTTATTATNKPSIHWSVSPSPLPSSYFPSSSPSILPTILSSTSPTLMMSNSPSLSPTIEFSSLPSIVPSELPTSQPSLRQPSPSPTPQPTKTAFFAIGEQYSDDYDTFEDVLSGLDPEQGNFLVHLGDFSQQKCDKEDFMEFSTNLNASSVPHFVVLGNDEWNDCASSMEGRQEAMLNFRSTFSNSDASKPHPSYEVHRNLQQPELFSFVQRKTLFLGVHIVGGNDFDDSAEENWEDHIQNSLNWVQNETTHQHQNYEIVVIFGNSRQKDENRSFFTGLRELIEELEVPTLYVFDGAQSSLQQRNDFYWTMEIRGGGFPFTIVSADTDRIRRPFRWTFATVLS